MSYPSFTTLRQSPVGSAPPTPTPNWNVPRGCSGSSSIRVTVSTRVTVTAVIPILHNVTPIARWQCSANANAELERSQGLQRQLLDPSYRVDPRDRDGCHTHPSQRYANRPLAVLRQRQRRTGTFPGAAAAAPRSELPCRPA